MAPGTLQGKCERLRTDGRPRDVVPKSRPLVAESSIRYTEQQQNEARELTSFQPHRQVFFAKRTHFDPFF